MTFLTAARISFVTPAWPRPSISNAIMAAARVLALPGQRGGVFVGSIADRSPYVKIHSPLSRKLPVNLVVTVKEEMDLDVREWKRHVVTQFA